MSCRDMVFVRTAARIRPAEYEALSEIRYRIQRFLVFSEASA